MTLDVCVIGAGRMGGIHAATVAGLPGAQLVTIADPDVPRATALAERLGAEATDVHAAITEYAAKLEASDVPKLLLYAQPGMITPEPVVEWAKTWASIPFPFSNTQQRLLHRPQGPRIPSYLSIVTLLKSSAGYRLHASHRRD